VIRELERRLREAGLPPLHWYDALQALHEAPERRLRHHELADAILLSRSGLSRLLDRLEGEGLIERQSCAEDRRGAHVVLTAAGDGVLRRMWTVHSAVLAVNFAAPVGAYAAGVKDALRAVSDRLRTGADDGATRERRRAPDRR
jgi:DNA-binding MarR family transcriptional regulator